MTGSTLSLLSEDMPRLGKMLSESDMTSVSGEAGAVLLSPSHYGTLTKTEDSLEKTYTPPEPSVKEDRLRLHKAESTLRHNINPDTNTLLHSLFQEAIDLASLQQQTAACRISMWWKQVRMQRVIRDDNTFQEKEVLLAQHNKSVRRNKYEEISVQNLIKKATNVQNWDSVNSLSQHGNVLKSSSNKEGEQFDEELISIEERIAVKKDMIQWHNSRLLSFSKQLHDLRRLRGECLLNHRKYSELLFKHTCKAFKDWKADAPRYPFDQFEQEESLRLLNCPDWSPHNSPMPKSPPRRKRHDEVEQMMGSMVREAESKIMEAQAENLGHAKDAVNIAHCNVADTQAHLETCRQMLKKIKEESGKKSPNVREQARLLDGHMTCIQRAVEDARIANRNCATAAGRSVHTAVLAVQLVTQNAYGPQVQKAATGKNTKLDDSLASKLGLDSSDEDSELLVDDVTLSPGTVNHAAKRVRRSSVHLVKAVLDAEHFSKLVTPRKFRSLPKEDEPREDEYVVEAAKVADEISTLAAEAGDYALKAKNALRECQMMSRHAAELLEDVNGSFSEFLSMASRGQGFMKHGKSGFPHERVIKLMMTEGGFTLMWRTKSMECGPHTRVLWGKKTAPLQRSKARETDEDLCFSVLSGSNTLALEAKDAKQRDYWARNIERCIRDLQLQNASWD